MSSFQLPEVLSDLAGQGRLESTGHFHRHLPEMLHKLEAQSQAQPESWLLFAIRAGVSLGATRIELSVRPIKIHVQLDPAIVFCWLCEPLGPDADPHLRTALLWAIALAGTSLHLEVSSLEAALSVTWSGTAFVERQVAPADWTGLRISLRQPRIDLDALRERLVFSPVPVYLQGERLSTGVLEEAAPADLLGAINYRRYVAAPAGPTLGMAGLQGVRPWHQRFGKAFETRANAWPPPNCAVVEFVGDPQRRELPLDRFTCRASFCRFVQRKRSYALPVRAGVTLDPIVLPGDFPPGWLVVIATDQLPVDFSGLQAVQGAEWLRLRQWICDTIGSIHRLVVNEIIK